jgi:hypothetical protein
MTQGDLLAEVGIDQAAAHADEVWLKTARRVVWWLIQDGQPFTTDECWARLAALDVSTHEPRALGAVLRAAARAGLIRASGEYRKTTRPEAHSRPVPVWVPVRRAA